MKFRAEIAQAIIDVSQGHDPLVMWRARWSVIVIAIGYAIRSFAREHKCIQISHLDHASDCAFRQRNCKCTCVLENQTDERRHSR